MQNQVIQAVSRIHHTKQIQEAIREKRFPMMVNGLSEPARGQVLAAVFAEQNDPCWILVNHAKEADQMADDLYSLGVAKSDILVFPQTEWRFYRVEAQNIALEQELVLALRKLACQQYRFAIFTPDNLLKRYPPVDQWIQDHYQVEQGQIISQETVKNWCQQLGYQRESKVEQVGQYAVRGSIIDLFVFGQDHPFRLDWFDDQIESIRSFDVLSQTKEDSLEQVELIPAKAYRYPQTEDWKERLENDAAQLEDEDIQEDVQRLLHGQDFHDMYRYVSYLYPASKTHLFSYLPESALFFLQDANRFFEKTENVYQAFISQYQDLLPKHKILKGQAENMLHPDYVMDHIGQSKLIYSQLFAMRSTHIQKQKTIINFDIRPIPSFQGQIPDLLDELVYLTKQAYQIYFCEPDRSKQEQWIQQMTAQHIPVLSLDETVDSDYVGVILIRDNYREGGIFAKNKLAIFTSQEIYGKAKAKSKSLAKKKKSKHGRHSKPIESFVELKAGDYVVHEVYGIGRFEEMETKSFDHIHKDYMKISYAKGDSLYVPLSAMDKVQKYIGHTGGKFSLSKLGTSEWKKKKARAKRAVDEIAKDIMELYATRKQIKGYAFGADTPWQKEFEDRFPFEETQDQLEAIADIKRDMQSNKPMDRLLCGDVGYGKTEVAIRAIFKAVMENKQVAFLVPTTILAQQHYQNFVERFADYPIRIEVMSRFKTKAQQAQIAKDVSKGLVDIIIGTHRILSKDLSFHDLGLLVVDEEQRFGVRQKEKLRKFKENVDTLSLSATPIPRTLHFSLSGIRDMSLLEEPPLNRHPVVSFVVEAREGIIQDAIERELSRGGQVFFVYNRVESIEKIGVKLQDLVPDAQIAIAHGQMSAKKLEDIMLSFLDKQIDVLLCTTIIETGLDIANANTMIIYDADKMGLSQLYQLRGRVGRSARQAYAYFLYQKDKVLSEVSEKRLSAIKEFTEFGSGFKIAMKDLEIRGAGNILGESQHGHMAEVGYDLYVRMLDQAITSLSGKEKEERMETEVDIPVNGYIPSNYIDDEMIKLELYKRIASNENLEEVDQLREEMKDRFGPVPLPVQVLLAISRVKVLAGKLGIIKIKHFPTFISFQSKDPSQEVRKKFKYQSDLDLLDKIGTFLQLMV